MVQRILARLGLDLDQLPFTCRELLLERAGGLRYRLVTLLFLRALFPILDLLTHIPDHIDRFMGLCRFVANAHPQRELSLQIFDAGSDARVLLDLEGLRVLLTADSQPHLVLAWSGDRSRNWPIH